MRPFAIVLIETVGEIKPLLPFAHLGVGVSSREEVDRLCELARASGCLVREAEDSGAPVGYWAFISDPDGHTLEVAYGQELVWLCILEKRMKRYGVRFKAGMNGEDARFRGMVGEVY